MKKLSTFLLSLWGTLTTASILFPGAAGLLKIPLAVQHSVIAGLYPVVPTIVAAFALLLLTVYRTNLSSLKNARRVAVSGISVALLLFFAFAGVRLFLLDVDVTKTYYDRSRNVTVEEWKRRGLVGKTLRQFPADEKPIEEQTRGDPCDLLGLILFTGTFASFTVAFGALGIHVYQEARLRDSNDSSPAA